MSVEPPLRVVRPERPPAGPEGEPGGPAGPAALPAGAGGVARRLAALAGPAHLASLAAAAPLLVWFNRDQWFFGDEWEFFANRMSGWGRVLFEPHNEHWSTVPILLYRALYAVAGVRSYVPYVVVLVVLHLAAAHLVWRVMNRVGVAPMVATALAAVFALLGAGGENLLWAFQIGFVGSVAAGLLHLLLVDHPGPFGRRDRIGWAVAVVGLACSGIGVTMTATAGLAVLLRRNARDALATVAPPAAVYLVWLAVAGHEGLADGGPTPSRLLDTPSYLWTGITSALEKTAGIPGAGAVLVVVLLGWLLTRRAVVRTAAAGAAAMAAGAALLFVVAGAGRADLGVAQATSGRYVYIAAALFLPAVGVVLSEATRGLPSRQLAVAGLMVPVVLHNVDLLRDQSAAEAAREGQVRAQILASAELSHADAGLVGAQPEPRFSPDVTVEVVRRLARDGALPTPTFGEADVLTAAAHLHVAAGALPPPGSPPARPTTGAPVDARGCLLVGPLGAAPADVVFPVPGAVSLRSPGGAEVTVALRSPVRPDVAGRPRTIAVAPGTTTWLHVARTGTVTLAGPGPAVEVCELGGG